MTNYYDEIKEKLLKNEIYGNDIIRHYADKLAIEVGKKYNVRTLRRIRQFYLLIEKGARLGHHRLLTK